MTSPEEDDLEHALRRALSAAADEVQAGGDGLDKIRTRIGDRPPRPWLFSVLFGILDRARNWTWRGHWAWPDSLSGLWARWEPRSRRTKFPRRDVRWDTRWLRVVTVVGGVAVIASVALGVQPFRQAILQASTSLNGGSGQPRGSTGTEGDGTQAGGGAPAADGATPTTGPGGQGNTATVTGQAQAAGPHSTSTAGCAPTARPTGTSAPDAASAPDAQTSPATVAADTSTSAAKPVTNSPESVVSASAKAATPATPATPANPLATNSNVATCPVTPVASGTPAATPAATSSSAAPLPTSQDVAPTPAWTPPTPTPTETDTGQGQDPTPTVTPTATDRASDPSWPSPHRKHTGNGSGDNSKR